MKIALLILAAGTSSRMGTPKQLLAVGDTTLLGSVIETTLNSNSTKVYCVLGAHSETIETSISKYNISTIFNTNYPSGLSSSIVSGIQQIVTENFDAVLIVLGDQPLITKQYLNTMIETFKKNDDNLIASQYNSKVGVPAIFPKSYFNQLLKLKGDKGAKDVLNTEKNNIIALEHARLIDIDTKKAYEDYLKFIDSK